MATSPKSAPRKYLLRVRLANGETVFPVDRFPCTVGRGPDCEIVLPDASVSTHHATFELDRSGALLLHDNQSTNGTYVENRLITSTRISPPARITMGQVTLTLEEKGAAASAAAAGSQPKPELPPLTSPPPHAASPASTGTTDCFYRRGGREHGPFSREQLQRMAADGTLHRTDLVWIDGAEAWLRADLIDGLFDAPPPAQTPDQAPGATAASGYIQELLEFPKHRARGDITCPHCWHTFDLEEFLYIARHQSLVGDPVLGPDAQQRFLPSKFTPEGHAIDSMGMSCPDMACPRCHLRIPKSVAEMPPLFLSIVGAPAAGKSYFLTGMAWELRNKLARNFAISFTDTDAVTNQILDEFEETLFLNSDPDQLVTLRKTELQGELYNQVMLDGMVINLPKPFMFTIMPAEHHPNYSEVKDRMSRTLVLYDNAGEHFEPGMDSVDNPTTRHLLHSDIIFFLFDPTKDARFRRLCRSDDPQVARGARVQRQEVLLTEMINRIKKYSGLRADAKTAKTLIIVVPKFDVWRELLNCEIREEPWDWSPAHHTCALDLEEIMNASFAVRNLLDRVCPEVVATAESFAGDVLYLPNSALGHSPEIHEETGLLGVRPRDIQPFWISVPMLYFFHERGFIPALPRNLWPERKTVSADIKVSGDVVFVTLPGRKRPLQVPINYMGFRLRDPDTGNWFELPGRRRRRGNRKQSTK